MVHLQGQADAGNGVWERPVDPVTKHFRRWRRQRIRQLPIVRVEDLRLADYRGMQFECSAQQMRPRAQMGYENELLVAQALHIHFAVCVAANRL